ncbi:MAG: Ferredoxin reductase, partial [uncultured Acetobacteraceae bacterium]
CEARGRGEPLRTGGGVGARRGCCLRLGAKPAAPRRRVRRPGAPWCFPAASYSAPSKPAPTLRSKSRARRCPSGSSARPSARSTPPSSPATRRGSAWRSCGVSGHRWPAGPHAR